MILSPINYRQMWGRAFRASDVYIIDKLCDISGRTSRASLHLRDLGHSNFGMIEK